MNSPSGSKYCIRCLRIKSPIGKNYYYTARSYIKHNMKAECKSDSKEIMALIIFLLLSHRNVITSSSLNSQYGHI